MDREKNFETTLPDGYEEVFSVDAKSKKLGLLLNAAALILTVVIIVIAALVIRPGDPFEEYGLGAYMIRCAIFIISLIVYLVLHELVHGIAYRILTGHKLKFGISLTCAWCGVPDIFVYRKTALISLLAPFTVFSVLLLAAAFFADLMWDKMLIMTIFAIHFGGCSGDLYDTILYLTKFREPTTLMQDTGPKQTFYMKK